jgi:hypothetical protein
MHDAALGADQADVSQTRSVSLRTDVNDVVTLLVKSRRPIFNALGVPVTRGTWWSLRLSNVVCKTAFPCVFDLTNRVCCDALCQEADFIFHHPISLHPTDGVFNPDSDGRDHAIACLLRGREFPTRGFFLRLDDCQSLTCIPLEAHILIETTSGWEGIAFQLSEALIIRLPFICSTQEANLTALIDHEEIFDRVALLRCSIPVGPLDRLGGGSVAPYHHAKKGGQRNTCRPFGCKHYR